jgi:hypothetical protein
MAEMSPKTLLYLFLGFGFVCVVSSMVIFLFSREISPKFRKTLTICNGLGISLLMYVSYFGGNGRPNSIYFLEFGREYQVTPINVPHGSFESPVLLHPLPSGQQQYFLVNPEVTEPGVYILKEENGKKVLKKK